MASVLCMLVVCIWTMKLNHDRVIMVANWQYCLAGKEIHMRVTEKLVKSPDEEGVTLEYRLMFTGINVSRLESIRMIL